MATRRHRPSAAAAEQPPKATYQIASYTVYPTGYDQVEYPGKESWCLAVVDAGNGWAIRRDDNCLNVALQWEKERHPELCDNQFMRRCRYNEHAALLRARRVIDRLEVWGLTFDEFVAQTRDQASIDDHD